MSGSEAGVMTGREPFTMGMNQPPVQNMRVAYSADGTAVYKPVIPTSPTYQSASSNGVGGGADGAAGVGAVSMNMGSETAKKKRGRPRKYGPESTMSLSLIPTPPSVAGTQPNNAGFSSPVGPGSAPFSGGSGSAASPTSIKKARGRPPGSTNKPKLEPLGSPGAGFTPHVITVQAGEDVSSKIMSFSQHGPRAVCILSANGAISNVTLRQPSTSGGTVTYQGRFEILSLSGSFLLTEYGGQRSRTGGLSVSLSGSDGRVLGGGVAGLLTAASPVQVIVGSFIADGRKESKSAHQFEAVSAQPKFTLSEESKSAHQFEAVSAQPKFTLSGVPTGTSSSPSHGTHSESSGGPSSPLNQSTGACNNNNSQSMLNMPWK